MDEERMYTREEVLRIAAAYARIAGLANGAQRDVEMPHNKGHRMNYALNMIEALASYDAIPDEIRKGFIRKHGTCIEHLRLIVEQIATYWINNPEPVESQ